MIDGEVRELIRNMWRSNLTWGKPRIQAELRKIGIEVSDSTAWRYRPPRGSPPSQSWRAFLDNHVRDIVAIDFFVVPTVTFRVLYVFLVMSHDRRRILHFNVTEHPTAAWTGQQLREAFPWDTAPRYMIRDRDGIYGNDLIRSVRALGIEQVLTAPRSPWWHRPVPRAFSRARAVLIFQARPPTPLNSPEEKQLIKLDLVSCRDTWTQAPRVTDSQ